VATLPARPGQPGLMRVINDRAALALLLEHGPLTRQQLGQATGLSGPTVSQMVRRLSQADLVQPAGEVSGTRGPNAATYRARADAALGVAIDIRARSASARLTDASDGTYPAADIRLADGPRSAAIDLERAIATACAAAGMEGARLTAICVGLPGAVAVDADELTFANDLPGWPRHRVRAQLRDALGVEVLIENDANLAAIAEAALLGPQSTFALVWQGEGLGVAYVADGEAHRGAAGGAGEIGYLPVCRSAAGLDPTAKDLQDLAGSRAVTRVVKAHVPTVRTFDAALGAIAASPERPAILADLAPRIAEAITPVIAVLDPATVVLGGPTGAACGAAGAALVQSHLRRTTRWRTPVVPTAVAGNPVLRGAALTLARHLGAHLLDRVT